MRLLAVVLLLVGLAPRLDAADGIRRCVARDGGSIYTDRPCETFDAVDRKPDAPATTTAAPEARLSIRSDCVRRTDTLLFELRRGIESENINQLAGLYHWPGISGRGARGIMDRLQRVASRPLSSVQLVFPPVTPVRDDPDAFPQGTPPEDPVGVRIEQSMPGEITPSFSEDLRLVRHAGCWWVAF
jgi:hypothetical protein